MTFSFRKIVWLVAALVVVGLVVLAFRPKPLLVDLGQVTRGALRVTVDAEGKTRVRRRFTVSTPVAGRLGRIDLDAGDVVDKGAVVARIDPLELDAAIQAAKARLAEWQAQRTGVATFRPKSQALSESRARIRAAQAAEQEAGGNIEKARAALEQAQREAQRAQRLEALGTISREQREILELTKTTRRREFEAAQLNQQRAMADVKAAQAAFAVLEAEQRDPDYLLDVYDARIASVKAELGKLQDDARRTEIRAPVRGHVLRVLQESERVVAAGTPLMELGDLAHIELISDVLSTDAVKIPPNAPVLIEHWDGDVPLHARVRRVEPSAFTKVSALGVEEQRVNVIADFLDPPDVFGDGYRVEVRIVVWERESVLKVPLSALFRCEAAWCVFVLEQGTAQQRRIVMGQRSAFEAEIQEGLTEGERVILHASDRVTHGIRVRSR